MDELLEKLRGLESFDDIGTLADQIGEAYTNLDSGSKATVEQTTAENESLKAEIQRLQAENYKLITANAASSDDDDPKAADEKPEDDLVIDDFNIDDVVEGD